LGAIYVLLIFAIGYIYCRINPATRFKIIRMDGYSLYFYIGVHGVLIAIFTLVIFYLVDLANLPTRLMDSYSLSYSLHLSEAKALDFNELKQLILCISAFCLALLMSFTSNVYSKIFRASRDKYMLKAAKSNDLELQLFQSTQKYTPVLITMDCDKVYVGMVYNFDPTNGKVEYLTILPLLSGYRDDKKKVKFTNNYYEHYKRYLGHKADDTSNNELLQMMMDFLIIIPTNEVTILSGFDVDAYKEFEASDFDGFADKALQ